MKKRFLSITLIVLMIAALLPVTAAAATDENGVSFSAEVTSVPQNGQFYVKGEMVRYQTVLFNGNGSPITEISVKLPGSTVSYGNPLEPNESEYDAGGTSISAEEVTAGEKILQFLATYTLEGQQYTIEASVRVETGREAVEFADAEAIRTGSDVEVSFTSDTAGKYAYAVTDIDAPDPENWDSYTKYDLVQGENSFVISDFTDNEAAIFLMAWNENNEPRLIPLKLTVRRNLPFIEDGFRALDETETFPLNEEVNLGGEGSVLYDVDGRYAFAKLIKVEAQTGQMLNMSFYGKNQSVDTSIEIYQEKYGYYECIERFDDDNKNALGENARYIIPQTGTYYIAFEGYDEESCGLCMLEADLGQAPQIVLLEDGFRALDEAETFPVQEEVDLGGEESVLYNIDDYYVFARLIKVEAQIGQILNMKFCGKNDSIDTYIEIYQEENGDYKLIDGFDKGNKNGGGENIYYVVPQTGTYYIAFEGYDENEIGLCLLEITALDSNVVMSALDFTQDPIPEAQEGDLWSWDAASKTLTLKDGFYLVNDDYDTEASIKLPDGATVLIEGQAAIYNEGENSLLGQGALTIRGTDPQTSALKMDCSYGYGIYTAGDLMVDNCALFVENAENGVCSDGKVTIQNAALNAADINDAICSREDGVVVTDSVLSVQRGGAGITSVGDVWVTDSQLSLDRLDLAVGSDQSATLINSDISVLDSNYGIGTYGTLVVDGGQLEIQTYYGVFSVYSLDITEKTILDLKIQDPGSEVLFLEDVTGFVLPGNIRLYDITGTVLYEGEWDSTLLGERGELSVNGVKVTRIQRCGNGDANGDGKISLVDVLLTARYVLDNTIQMQVDQVDMNGDGKISLVDVLAIARLVISQ